MFWVLDSFCSSSLSRTRPEGWNTIKTLKFSFSYIKKQTERIHHWCIIRLKSGIGLFRCSVLNIQDFDLIIFYTIVSFLHCLLIELSDIIMILWRHGVWGLWGDPQTFSGVISCFVHIITFLLITAQPGPSSRVSLSNVNTWKSFIWTQK